MTQAKCFPNYNFLYGYFGELLSKRIYFVDMCVCACNIHVVVNVLCVATRLDYMWGNISVSKTQNNRLMFSTHTHKIE